MERKISAAAFKARCLALIDEVAESGQPIIVTKRGKATVQIIACSPTNSAVMQHSVAAGRLLDEESLDTLSDGTAGGVEPGAITFDLVRDLVDGYVDVAEDDPVTIPAGHATHGNQDGCVGGRGIGRRSHGAGTSRGVAPHRCA